MSTLSDKHTHFTGSLPVSFLEKFVQENFADVNRNIISQIRKRAQPKFTSSPKQNIDLFFESYSYLQKITKLENKECTVNLYQKGTKAIVESFANDNVFDFEIIAGPRKSWGETKLRIDNMIKGLGISKGKIRLTFIRDYNEEYFNYSEATLDKIFNEINTNIDWNNKISGFDLSGIERCNNLKDQIKIISDIKLLNLRREKLGKSKLSISVHAGEDLINNSSQDLINYFEKLLDLDIQKIGHGTFLWIPKKYLQISDNDILRRIKLLEKIKSKDIELEICPKANLLLSPIKSYEDIPVSEIKAMDIKFTLNTDNKSIFNTSLPEIYNHLNLMY